MPPPKRQVTLSDGRPSAGDKGHRGFPPQVTAYWGGFRPATMKRCPSCERIPNSSFPHGSDLSSLLTSAPASLARASTPGSRRLQGRPRSCDRQSRRQKGYRGIARA